MYSKIINPSKMANSEYNNKGSSNRLFNYLVHDVSDKNSVDHKLTRENAAIFFNQSEDFISKKEAEKTIDENTKGLKATDDKFFSLIISPSKEELIHIADSDKKLKEYTKIAMENYAKNFRQLDKENSNIDRDEVTKKIDRTRSTFVYKEFVKPEDLVWNATIHKDRYYRKKDENLSSIVTELKKQNKSKEAIVEILLSDKTFKKNTTATNRVNEFYETGRVKEGQKKIGLNTHIHVTVSARDREQKVTLKPYNIKRFQMTQWQASNEISFNQKHKFHQGKILRAAAQKEFSPKEIEKKMERISAKLEVINKFLYDEVKLDRKKVLDIAEFRKYDAKFFYSMSSLENRLKDSKPVNNAYHYLEHGKDEKQSFAYKQDFFDEMSRAIQKETHYSSQEQSKDKKKRRGRQI